jgi:hypothetical protein
MSDPSPGKWDSRHVGTKQKPDDEKATSLDFANYLEALDLGICSPVTTVWTFRAAIKEGRPMKRASSVTNLAAKCLGIMLAMAGGVALAVPQNQPQKPSYTLAEYNAFRVVSAETNPQVRIKLVDDFTARFPHSVLMGFMYQNYSVTSFGLKNYPQAVVYADKFLALGDDELLALGNSDLPFSALESPHAPRTGVFRGL